MSPPLLRRSQVAACSVKLTTPVMVCFGVPLSYTQTHTLRCAQVSAAQARIARHPELGLVVHANLPDAKGVRAGAAADQERLQARRLTCNSRWGEFGGSPGTECHGLT